MGHCRLLQITCYKCSIWCGMLMAGGRGGTLACGWVSREYLGTLYLPFNISVKTALKIAY